MTLSDIRIREAEPADLAGVAEMHYAVWRQSWTGVLIPPLLDLLGPPRRWATQVYPQSLSRRGWSMWIAESGGEPVGVTIFGPDADDPECLMIDALYIPEQLQRHGIGGLLLDAVLTSRTSGDVLLWCSETNVKARRFYEKNNFHADGRRLDWEPLPGVSVPHVGYRLKRR